MERKRHYHDSSSADEVYEESLSPKSKKTIDKLITEHVELRIQRHLNKERLHSLKDQLAQWQDKSREIAKECSKMKKECEIVEESIKKLEVTRKSTPRFPSIVDVTTSEDETNDYKQPINVMPIEYRSNAWNENPLCLWDMLRHYRIMGKDSKTGRSKPLSCRYPHQMPVYWHANQLAKEFPDKYCKYSALCQITREFADKGNKTLL